MGVTLSVITLAGLFDMLIMSNQPGSGGYLVQTSAHTILWAEYL